MHILTSFIDNMMKMLRPSSKTETPPPVESPDIPILEEIKVGEVLETTIQADSLQGAGEEKGSVAIDTTDINLADDSDSIGERISEASDHGEAGLCITQPLSGEETIDMESEDPPAEELPPSLLDNKSFVKLAEECVDAMDEFDGYIERLESDEGKMIAEMIVKRLQELLERSGLQRIDDVNEPFSVLRHIPVPMEPVSEGASLDEIIQAGLALENRTLLKAKVKVQKTE